MNLLRRSQLHFVHCLLPGAGPEGPVPRPPPPPDAAPQLDIPTLRAQLEGTQLLDALRLHRVGMPGPPPLPCAVPPARPFHASLITCLSPAPLQNGHENLLMLFTGLHSPNPVRVAHSEYGGCSSGGFPRAPLGASVHRLDLHRGQPMPGAEGHVLCDPRHWDSIWPPQHISAASLLALPCPRCRGFSLLRAAPLVPPPLTPFSVPRMRYPSQQPPPAVPSPSFQYKPHAPWSGTAPAMSVCPQGMWIACS